MQEVKIIRSNRKTIALHINENAELVVRAPQHVPLRQIKAFIKQKREWIDKSRRKALLKKEIAEENKQFKDGKKVYYLGQEYEVRLNGKIKDIYINEGTLEFPFSKIESAEEFLIKWYKQQAREVIVEMVEQAAKKLDLKYSKVGITSAKGRWGSCNAKGNLNFSYRLVMCPMPVIEYVVIHELMHLKEMNHSQHFWALVGRVVPDYKQRRKWLKENQFKLTQ